MNKYFDFIVVLSFTTMLGLTLSMWVSYDKLQTRLNQQREIIGELIYENQSLSMTKDALADTTGQLETELNRCRVFLKGTY